MTALPPIIKMILAGWQATLLTISKANGFHTDVVDVLRLPQPPASAHNDPYVNIEEVREDKVTKNPLKQVTVEVVLRLVVKNDYDNPEDDIIDLASDVEKRSEEDLGRYASGQVQTLLTSTHYLPVHDGDEYIECLQTYELTYRHLAGNPEAI